MRRLLVISSYVARGTVGLQATVPALMRPDFDVMTLPTIVLSNHPGHAKCAGTEIAPETLAAMVEALDDNGWLASLDAFFTGYLPSAAHAEWARRTLERIKRLNRETLYVADPVIGDDPGGLYVSRDTAEAVRDLLLPLADVITPNRFELSWLSAQPVTDRASAITAGRQLRPRRVIATSIPEGPERLANLLIAAGQCAVEVVPLRSHAPHGTGDYFAGQLLAALLEGRSDEQALGSATSATARVLEASRDDERLNLSGIGPCQTKQVP
jgi:pyridoxine kinase